jgi:hypothetical protein
LLSLRKELLISSVLLVLGFVIVPFCIYIVGQNVFGSYSEESGAFGLVTTIWADLASFSLGAWILVLSPWAVIQLLRFSVHLWRGPKASAEAG